MVLEADAIVYPRAVMVETVYTCVAEVAVATSRRTNYFTLGTEAIGLVDLEKLQKVHLLIFLQFTRVTKPGNGTECQGEKKHYVGKYSSILICYFAI